MSKNPSSDPTPTPTPVSVPTRSAISADDEWVPEDRAPSAAENNFMSFALFAFLILFALGCVIFL